MDTKTCSHCHQTFPANNEYFHKHSKRKDGLNSLCKTCACAVARQWQKDNPERAIQKSREWAIAHPDRKREISMQSYYRNHERALVQHKRYRDSAKGKATAAQYRAKIADAMRDYLREWRAKNPSKFKAIQTRYRKTHPHVQRNSKARRRLRIIVSPTHFSQRDVERQYDNQNGLCYWCHQPLCEKYHVDHVIPLSKGGTDAPENIVCACARCNRQKGTLMPDEFVAKHLTA